MGMFLNYHNIADNYIPNNLINEYSKPISYTKLDPKESSKPFEERDIRGNLIGYFWRQGETLNLEFNIDGEITLENDSIIMKTHGQTPKPTTIAKPGQRAYNIVDLVSWTCIGSDATQYYWEPDMEFTYPLNGDKKVYIPAANYLMGKTVEVTLYNFRMEPICKKLFDAEPTIIFAIDKELSATLPRGIYYCSVDVYDHNVCFNIFGHDDGCLVVK